MELAYHKRPVLADLARCGREARYLPSFARINLHVVGS